MPNKRTVVLVVEDEALVRMDIVDQLEDAGFEVFEATNSIQAIDILIANPRIDAMFTDVDMPGGVDGLKLAASVRDRWPPITIIVTSGHRVVDIESLPAKTRFMPKPYNPAAVVRSLRDMMAL